MYDSIREMIRLLGIDPSCRGVMYITEILEEKKTLDDLNDDQVELIVDAWDSRAYIPQEIHEKMFLQNAVKPDNNEQLPREVYYRNVAKNVINFFK